MDHRFVNTEELRRTSIEFAKTGSYIKALQGTRDYVDFWREEKRRCLEGYSVGGLHITGYHYFYLNFCQIERVDDAALLSKNNKGVDKIKTFPAFWDGDYDYFWALEIARYGIDLETYNKLGLGISINPEFLGGGRHLAVLKARGKGYSYKAGAMLARNFNLKRNSKNYAMASEKEYLIKDGVLDKCWDNISFLDNHTAYRQPRIKDQEMHKMSGYKRNIDGTDVVKGTLNQVIGVSLKDDPDKARGKRGELIFFEEAGKLPGLLKAWEVCRPSVEQGAMTTGIQIAFGTGGTKDADYEGLEELFYHPESNNILPIENMWDEGARGTLCSFFVPTFQNWEGYMDSNGNSDIDGATEYHNDQRDLKKKSKDNNALDQYVCENPFTPREATLQTSSNMFPTQELKMQFDSVSINARYNAVSNGILVRNENGVVNFQPSREVKPILEYPMRSGTDETGAISILEAPFKDQDGKIPQGLYCIGHDPYATDKSSTSPSLGASYVIKRTNNFTNTLNECIVASYVGRPSSQDEYNRNIFMLAEYYGCKIGFENDRGDIIGYAKRFKKLSYLEEEFEMLDKRELRSNVVNRPYGMHMTEARKSQGEIYLRDWLLEPILFDDEGNTTKLRLNTILDPALLQELIRFNRKGNFDRAMALMISMYYLKELHHAEVAPRRTSPHSDFFDRDFFQ